MKKAEYSIHIKASREKVWKTLWDDASYREWTAVFTPGSHVVTNWKEGSKAQFLNNEGAGMYSIIEKNKPNEFISFKHLGEVKNGKEQPIDEKAESWSGSHENYTLIESKGGTDLKAEMDSTEEMFAYFDKTFPKALEKVKEIAER